jgi:hydroxyacylglutathione hydrolase
MVPDVIVERSMSDQWLSNAYLVADEPGGHAVIIDSGAPTEPILEAVERHGVTVDKLLLTHHHHDHVAENSVYKERFGVEILAHPLEAQNLMDVDRAIEPGEVIQVGGLRIDGLHTPGHTAGMLSFRVNDGDVFTGDTLFKGSVGGVRAPGSTSFEDLRQSIMDVLMKLPPETRLHPGHTDPTTVGDEWEQNAFIRVWRGLDEESSDRCRVGEEEATLVLFAPDYDGGHKAWVRWDETGRDDIVPGSMVERL